MIDFNTITKIAQECGRFGEINCYQKILKSCPKSNKLPNLVTLATERVILENFVHIELESNSLVMKTGKPKLARMPSPYFLLGA